MIVADRGLPAARLARWAVAVFRGRHDWGTLRSFCDRRGTVWITLAVYPSTISGRRRQLLRLWRGWPLVGVALLVPALLIGHLIGSVGLAAIVLAVAFVAAGITLKSEISPERTQVAEWHGSGDRPLGELQAWLDRLVAAEHAHDVGRLTDAEYAQVRRSVHREVSAATRG